MDGNNTPDPFQTPLAMSTGQNPSSMLSCSTNRQSKDEVKPNLSMPRSIFLMLIGLSLSRQRRPILYRQ